MRMKVWILSATVMSIGVAAWAHGGATGIVKERMDGMSAMGKAVKTLTPMMRGQAPFQADGVRNAADTMIMHAGEQMTGLFKEGTGGKPSQALPSVWSDWEEFAELAEDLKIRAEGLKLSADNGMSDGLAQGSASMMGGSSSTMMGSEGSTMMGGGTTMMGGTTMGSPEAMTAEMIASMPADMAFTAVAQTCSACHQKFRSKEK